MIYGPNTKEVELFFRRLERLSSGGFDRILGEFNKTPDDERLAALEAVRFEHTMIDRSLPRTIWLPSGDAVAALIMRDLIDDRHFRTLYGPWASVFGWPD